MSLYGALFGGVSGLRAQSSKIGVISDNIANVNTIGYKQGTATFQTLVVNTSNAGSYQTGGVRSGTVLNVSKQGLLQSTESATDIAISGAGFFVVRANPTAAAGDSSATPYYTRAGSFTQDSLGNFKNTQGYFLQGWPLDREGRLPGEVGNANTTSFTNFDSLETVNVESASGVAQSTSNISLGANLKSSQAVYPGEAVTLKPDANTANNQNLQADGILVGSEFTLDNGTNVNDLRRGDQFTVSTPGLSYTYEYGGYAVGRSSTIVGGSINFGDNPADNTALKALDANANVTYVGTNSFDISIPNHGLITGDKITLAGLGANWGNTPISELNSSLTVTRVDANTVRITTATAHGQAAGNHPLADAFTADTRVFTGNVLDATSPTGIMLIQTGTTDFTGTALTFSISNATTGTKTFKYTNTAPNSANGEFNSLTTLASAINSVNGLTARVVNGRLVVGAENASEAVTFTNGDATGTATQRGINWISEFGLKNVDVGNRRYSTLSGLAALVNQDEGVSAVVSNPLSSASLAINVDDPLSTITMTDGPPPAALTGNVNFASQTANGTPTTPAFINMTINTPPTADMLVGGKIYLSGMTNGVGGLPGALPNGGPFEITALAAGSSFSVKIPVEQTVSIGNTSTAIPAAGRVSVANVTNQGSPLAQLGVLPTLNGVDYLTGYDPTFRTTGALGPQYDPTGQNGGNMASGDITAQFSRNVRVYDSLGSGHDVRFSFIKIAQNSWAVEAHMIPASDISTTLADGQIAVGQIVFNGDGTLRSVSSSLQNAIDVTWRNGATPSKVTLDMGTAGDPFGTVGSPQIGLSDGLSQFDSAYNVNFANQNGAPVGQLVSVAITTDGLVVASYSNGQTQSLYKLPLADFANPDGLNAVSGNVFSETRESGTVNLREPGTNGTGTLVAGALEASNVDLAEQLTDMIVAQRAYQANTKVIKTADDLLNELNQI